MSIGFLTGTIAVIGFTLNVLMFYIDLKVIEHEEVREWQFGLRRVPKLWHLPIYIFLCGILISVYYFL